MYLLIFRRTPICDVRKRAKIRSDPCRRNPESREDRIPQATHFEDTITTDHKVLNEENESRLFHRYAVVVQDSATQLIQGYPLRNKTAQDAMNSLQRFLPPESKPGGIHIAHFIAVCMATNREAIQSATLSQRGKTLPYGRKKSTMAGYYAVEIQKRSESELNCSMRICINSGLNIVNSNHELQHGNCTQVFSRSVGPREQGYVLQIKNCYRSDLLDRNQS